MQEDPLNGLIGEPSYLDVHKLTLEEVYHAALDTICDRIGFSFATISIRDDDEREIRTVASRNVPLGWQQDAHHSLGSYDIQSEVLRTGETEIIAGWDPRFDKQIWEKYNHADLVRVWVPLDDIGTIEAGFIREQYSRIPPLLLAALKLYARSVTVAIKNALELENKRKYADALARIFDIGYQLPHKGDEYELLEQITKTALTALNASVILLYPVQHRDYLAARTQPVFSAPIVAGEIEGHQQLKPPERQDNIVHYIAKAAMPYFQPDVAQDPLLTGTAYAVPDDKSGPGPKHRTFAVRQNIRSFAGVPLLARGTLLGVLCVNYRQRHQFFDDYRKVIELFASQAASIIASNELVRTQERNRLQADLHDTVKSALRGVLLLSKSASETVKTNPDFAAECLHELRRGIWTVLGDIDLILDNLATGWGERKLDELIGDEVVKILGKSEIKAETQLQDGIPAVSPRISRVVLGILREALVNIVEHSTAHNVRLEITRGEQMLCLQIRDDGKGFDDRGTQGPSHHGLEIMQRRALEIGGTVEIKSAVGEGTRLVIQLPLQEN